MNEKQKKPLTRQERQVRRILTTIAVIALFSLLVGMLIGIMIGFSFKGADKQSKEPLLTTAYADGENIEAIPLSYETEQWQDLGEFTCYAYDACAACCGKSDGITKSGTKATAGRTIAVDPSVIPLGSTVEIDGVRYIAEDTGGKIKGNVIDIYFDAHEQALDYGKQIHSVKVLN